MLELRSLGQDGIYIRPRRPGLSALHTLLSLSLACAGPVRHDLTPREGRIDFPVPTVRADIWVSVHLTSHVVHHLCTPASNMSTSPHYSAIAQRAIELFQFYSDANPSARSTHAASEPSSADGLPALDFDVRTLQAEDRYLYGNFVDGTWVSKLESDVEGEQGMYNVAVSVRAVVLRAVTDQTGRSNVAYCIHLHFAHKGLPRAVRTGPARISHPRA